MTEQTTDDKINKIVSDLIKILLKASQNSLGNELVNSGFSFLCLPFLILVVCSILVVFGVFAGMSCSLFNGIAIFIAILGVFLIVIQFVWALMIWCTKKKDEKIMYNNTLSNTFNYIFKILKVLIRLVPISILLGFILALLKYFNKNVYNWVIIGHISFPIIIFCMMAIGFLCHKWFEKTVTTHSESIINLFIILIIIQFCTFAFAFIPDFMLNLFIKSKKNSDLSDEEEESIQACLSTTDSEETMLYRISKIFTVVDEEDGSPFYLVGLIGLILYTIVCIIFYWQLYKKNILMKELEDAWIPFIIAIEVKLNPTTQGQGGGKKTKK